MRLENRRPFTGLVSSTKSPTAIWGVAAKGRRSGAKRRPSGAAASNLTLSAICAIKMGPVRGSDEPLG